MTSTITEAPETIRARHCEQAQAGYWYCQATDNDPCGHGRYPHDGCTPGQCISASVTPYQRGLKDGEHAAIAGLPFSACRPSDAVREERYAAMYRNGWESAYIQNQPGFTR